MTKKCAACEVVCHKCSKKGHFCRSANVQVVDTSNSQPSDDNFLGGQMRNWWSLDGNITTEQYICRIQGAEVTVVSEMIHKKVGCLSLMQSDQTLKGPSNHSLLLKGKFLGQFQCGRFTTEQKFCCDNVVQTWQVLDELVTN